MTNERKAQLFNNLLDWITQHDDEFIKCSIDVMGLSEKEIEELDLDWVFNEKDDEYDDEDYDYEKEDKDLPEQLDIDVTDLDCDAESLEEAVSNYMNDRFDYLPKAYDFSIEDDGIIKVKNIFWDTYYEE